MGARNSEINIPARPNTAVADICSARIESAKRLRLCLTPWPWRVRCGAVRCALRVSAVHHHPGRSSAGGVISVGVDRRRVANNTIPPHYRHPPRQRQTTSERTLARPLAPRCLPRSLSSLCARGLSDATRRRITRRSARSEVGRPATGQPSDTFS